MNLVLGAVVESFSFAFQDYGKVTRIKRSDMRDFKRVWANFDTERTGYIQPRDVGRFLGVSCPSPTELAFVRHADAPEPARYLTAAPWRF